MTNRIKLIKKRDVEAYKKAVGTDKVALEREIIVQLQKNVADFRRRLLSACQHMDEQLAVHLKTRD